MAIMTYVCPNWEYAVDAHLLKLQRLQNRVLRAIGNLHRCTPVPKLYVAFKIPYMYDCITKLCMIQAEVNHVNLEVNGIGQGEARRRKYMRLEPGGNEAYEHSAD
jgi:hypothetical protein